MTKSKTPAKSYSTDDRDAAAASNIEELFVVEADEDQGAAPGAEPDISAVLISAADIDPNPHQPRRNFDRAELEKLGAAMREETQINAILVQPAHDGRYELIAGERRWRAAQLAGIEKLHARVRYSTPHQSALLAYNENAQRSDLTAVERGRSFLYLKKLSPGTVSGAHTKRTWRAVAAEVGMSERAVARYAELLELPQDAQDLLDDLNLSEKHGRALLMLQNDEKAQRALLREMQRGEMTGDAANKRAEELRAGPSEKLSLGTVSGGTTGTSGANGTSGTSGRAASEGTGMDVSGGSTAPSGRTPAASTERAPLDVAEDAIEAATEALAQFDAAKTRAHGNRDYSIYKFDFLKRKKAALDAEFRRVAREIKEMENK